MATRLWHYLYNTFLINTRKNFKKTLTLITDHLAKLESQNSDADILAMYNSFKPLQESFENIYSQWQLTLGTYEGKTQGFKERLQHFSVEQINVWRGIVFNVFPEHSPEAKEIFYDDRQPFQTGTYEQRVNSFKTLGDKLAEYTTKPALLTLSAEVLLAHTELKSLRDAQQNKEGASGIFSAALETARVIVCEEMYSILGLLMSKYKQTPEIVANYYDLSLLRDIGGNLIFPGPVEANSIISITEELPEDFQIPLTTKIRITNTSQNPATTIIAYPANNATDPPGPGPQFPIAQGAFIEKTLIELGLSTFDFFNIQNPSDFDGSWEIEILS